jgi:hypothetical protein
MILIILDTSKIIKKKKIPAGILGSNDLRMMSVNKGMDDD